MLGITEKSLRLRIKDLAKQCQIQENILVRGLRIREEIAYDGFESFSNSQFSPNYINTAVGRSSHYTYATTYSPLNRKGAMTKWQKQENEARQRKFGKYPTSSVKDETGYIFEKLLSYADGKLTIWTDEHKSYSAALKSMREPNESNTKQFHQK